MEPWVLAQYATIEGIKAEIEAMKALNQYRIDRGETIAYDADAFQVKADDLFNISDLILKLSKE